MELPNKRYEGLHKPIVLSPNEFKSLKKYLNCDIFKNLRMLQRIGSNSVYATVWLAAFNSVDLDVTFAIKVQKDVQKSEKEAEISYFLESWFDNFLLMYSDIYCEKIILNNFLHDGTFMFMEVAMSDLKQMITFQNVTKEELISYILNVCDSIEIMASNFLYHGDLHIGNVFIVKRDSNIKAVVGDFGESIFTNSPTSHLSDLATFISSLSIEIKNALNNLLSENKLLTLMKHINKQTSLTEREYDLFIEENEDSELQKDKIQQLVQRDMGIIKDLIQGIF